MYFNIRCNLLVGEGRRRLCVRKTDSVVIGAWVGPKFGARVISVVALDLHSHKRSIQLLPAAVKLRFSFIDAKFSAFAIARPSFAWAAIGWDDGTATFSVLSVTEFSIT